MAGEPLTDTLVDRWRETMGRAHGIVNLMAHGNDPRKMCLLHTRESAPACNPLADPCLTEGALVLNKADQLCGIGEPGE